MWPPWPPALGDHHLTGDEFGYHSRQSIELALRPAEFDRDILAFDIAGFVQALTERLDNGCRLARGPTAEISNHASPAAARALRSAKPPRRQEPR
jgi:hypothetical protein